jgi:hypothetical protein
MGQEIQEAGPPMGMQHCSTDLPPSCIGYEQQCLIWGWGLPAVRVPEKGVPFSKKDPNHTYHCPDPTKKNLGFSLWLVWLLAWSLDDRKASALSPVPGK